MRSLAQNRGLPWLTGLLGLVAGAALAGLLNRLAPEVLPGINVPQSPPECPRVVAESPATPCPDPTAQLRALRIQLAFAKGQLTTLVGEPQDWPLDAAGFKPEAVAASIDRLLAAHPELDVLEVDCSEYPCLVMFTGENPGPDGYDAQHATVQQFLGGEALMGSTLSFGDDRMFSVVVAGPEASEPDSDLQRRTQHRMQSFREVSAEAFVDQLRARANGP